MGAFPIVSVQVHRTHPHGHGYATQWRFPSLSEYSLGRQEALHLLSNSIAIAVIPDAKRVDLPGIVRYNALARRTGGGSQRWVNS